MHGSESMAVESNLADQGVLRFSCLSKYNRVPAGITESILYADAFECLGSRGNKELKNILPDYSQMESRLKSLSTFAIRFART